MKTSLHLYRCLLVCGISIIYFYTLPVRGEPIYPWYKPVVPLPLHAKIHADAFDICILYGFKIIYRFNTVKPRKTRRIKRIQPIFVIGLGLLTRVVRQPSPLSFSITKIGI